MRAIVVGAGIGGLAAALSLRRAGVDVTLMEQARRFSEIGAGIQLAPNATRELRRLGVLDAVAAPAAHPPHVSFLTWSDGSEICRYALGQEAEEEFGAPHFNPTPDEETGDDTPLKPLPEAFLIAFPEAVLRLLQPCPGQGLAADVRGQSQRSPAVGFSRQRTSPPRSQPGRPA